MCFALPQWSLAASSTAVLVQLTPLLGVLLGIVGTVILVTVFVAICIKMNKKVSPESWFLFHLLLCSLRRRHPPRMLLARRANTVVRG